MLFKREGHKFGLPFRLQTPEPDEHDSRVVQALAKYQLAEILAAKAIAARIPATVNRGCSDKICSMVSPAASFSKISSTVIRVPETVGFPIMILGSELMRASDTRNLDSF